MGADRPVSRHHLVDIRINMKVHELVALYKQTAVEMRESFEAALWRHNRRTAYLQSLDPMRIVEDKPPLWDGFLEWDNKQRNRKQQ